MTTTRDRLRWPFKYAPKWLLIVLMITIGIPIHFVVAMVGGVALSFLMFIDNAHSELQGLWEMQDHES